MAIKLTEVAVEQIKDIAINQNVELDKSYVRVGIQGRSCSGNVYAFGFDDEVTSNDEINEHNGIRLIHDKKYSSDLKNIIIDFKDFGDTKGFTFKNPLQLIEEENSGGCSSGGGCCGGGKCG
jgi:iron-sulfur cluster assembly protein